MKKVMFHLHCLRKGGAERVVVNLAERFWQDGIAVTIAIVQRAADDYNLTSEIQKLFVGLSDTEELKSGRPVKFIHRIKKLRTALQEEKPDVLIAFGKSSNYRSILAAAGTDIPVVVSVRNDPEIDYAGKRAAICNKLLLNRAAGCVFQTEKAREFFDIRLQKRSCIIINPIHDKYFAARTPVEKEPVIVTVGRMAKQKNQLLLLRAFRKIIQIYPEYKLRIFGGRTEDDTQEKLYAYVKKNNLEDRVDFMGIRDDLEKEIPKAAIFVLSSDYEGMPNALMEAMAMGMPVVSTDCPCNGPRMLIRDGENGLLVPVGDVNKLTEAIQRLIEDPILAQKIGEQAKSIKELADAETIYSQWKQYIEKIIGQSK